MLEVGPEHYTGPMPDSVTVGMWVRYCELAASQPVRERLGVDLREWHSQPALFVDYAPHLFRIEQEVAKAAAVERQETARRLAK